MNFYRDTFGEKGMAHFVPEMSDLAIGRIIPAHWQAKRASVSENRNKIETLL